MKTLEWNLPADVKSLEEEKGNGNERAGGFSDGLSCGETPYWQAAGK